MLTFGENLRLRFEVCFDIRFSFAKCTNRGWVETESGVEVGNWLKENTLGDYSIQANNVLFEERDDALLCYLRYKG